jgi:hypothetical protein
MSFLPRLFRFKELIAGQPSLATYTRSFKVVHPSDEYPDGGLAFADGVSDTIKAVVVGLWQEAGTALHTTKQPV